MTSQLRLFSFRLAEKTKEISIKTLATLTL